MDARPSPFTAFRVVAFGMFVGFLYLFLFRTSYFWLSLHFQGGGDYRVYLKLFWAMVFAFAFDQSFKKIGLKLPRRDSLKEGVVIPLLIVLVCYEAIGYYVGWNATSALHNLCVGTSEELICNGCIIALLRPIGVTGSAYISGLIFTSFHFPHLWNGEFTFNDFETAIGIFSTGIFLAGIRFYADSLLPGIVIHSLLDYMIDFYSPTHSIFAFANYNPTPLVYTLWEWSVEFILLVYGIALLVLSKKRAAAVNGRRWPFRLE